MKDESYLRIADLSAGYGTTRVLENVSLSIRKGEFVALLGSSGCGKTTLLRAIAGFVQPSSGAVSVAGRDVTRLPPDRRGMALVFQSYALWPHMTVAQNIGYGLKLKGMPREAIARRVGELEGLLGLSGLGQRKPAALSGGQRQRVALGRALAIDPQILLLDEPLSNLDARIRFKVRHDISALQKRLGITAVHVTHDREEAMVMADRIVIMDAGRIAQQGRPEDIYNRPASSFVAAFMGAENMLNLSGRVAGGVASIDAGPDNDPAALQVHGPALSGGTFEARFRAEAAELLPDSPVSRNSEGCLHLFGHVEAVSYPGGTWRHSVRVGQDDLLVDSRTPFERGSAVRVRIPADKLFLFNAKGVAGASHTSSLHHGRKDRVLEAAET
ncbi:ABC transporter ATP-binding protein [Mesorhizobium australicum]|uniref:Carbohydrate ABC transporter ATP-binding protein, CUT1 family n=1 Tax=Mesorhizobium australicum TaxID=536018 RepID=A0A1X7NGY1_9HYPH|nr:ABC transporter ATP-binding protein [Mesorhizobium australicum]SMH37047.1 carbohydrate ABC transporter ATP-binding protein, CUT1 family [Mesorhizobium australicum]